MKQAFLFLSLCAVINSSAQQTNYHFSSTDSTTASAEKIWQIWTNVPDWENWDKGLKDAQLFGTFMVGTRGTLIPDQGPKSKFIITEIVPGRSYTFKTRIPLGRLVIKRTLEGKNARTYFTHDVQFTGILKKILGNKLGKKYRLILPETLKNIRQMAETKEQLINTL
ncbi:polyketide cyclase [Flavipsychrobacter stenotrophus]|uniref:Polyketide cyclase n=1 Tax=Flavipsychrobacter stenotrophus TaxID=2077091 RepID=A0A2S7SQB3_9BACT|nr:polyketide cyclase [Flavipsychrobacter stenotrophus]PQJ09093.1 polyketide cyclase [Flavipsychrobacter stenotrophus]